MVPWYQGGPAYGHYADGYYGSYAMNGLFPAFLIGSMMGGLWSPAVIEPPADLGGDAAGGDWSTEGGGTDGLDSMDGIGEVGGGEHTGGDLSGGDDGGGLGVGGECRSEERRVGREWERECR